MKNNFYSFEDTLNKSLVVKDNFEFILSSSSLSSYEYLNLISNDVAVHALYLYYETIRQKDNSFQRLIKFFKDLDSGELILSSVDSYHSDIKTYEELYKPIGFNSLSGSDLFYWYKEYREIYSYVKNALSSGEYLKEFSESVGNTAYFNEYDESILPLNLTEFPSLSESVKEYSIMLNNKLSNSVREFIDESTTNTTLLQRNNIKNIVGSKSPDTPHGENLITDILYSNRIDVDQFKNTLKEDYKQAYRLLNLFNERIELSSFKDFVYELDSTIVDRLQTRVKYLLN